MELKINSLKKSVSALERTINAYKKVTGDDLYDEEIKEATRAGVIQNFEVAYEQSWKMMKRWIKENRNPAGLEGFNMREIYRLSAEFILIDDVEKWMGFHRARNLTSHTYDEVTAEDTISTAIEFLPYANALVERLERVE